MAVPAPAHYNRTLAWAVPALLIFQFSTFRLQVLRTQSPAQGSFIDLHHASIIVPACIGRRHGQCTPELQSISHTSSKVLVVCTPFKF